MVTTETNQPFRKKKFPTGMQEPPTTATSTTTTTTTTTITTNVSGRPWH